jgi:hypothetical protein
MITLTREEAQKTLDALEDAVSCGDFIEVYKNIKEKLNEPTIDGWPLYSGLPQPEPEPMAYMDSKGHLYNSTTHPENYTPLYTATPQREWVGLTDEEKTFIAWESNNGLHCVALTEAKLKEKNG